MSEALKRIAVLVSVGRHPVSGALRYSRNDAAALAMATGLRRQAADFTIDVIHAGDAGNPALLDYLALGAATISVIETTAQQDILPALRQCLDAYDLVLCGSRAEGGEESGLLPYLLAAQLNLSIVAGVIAVKPESDALVARQFLPKGRRREVGVTLPAVLMVHPLAPSSARYAYARLRAGRIVKQMPDFPAARDEQAHDGWTVAPAKAKPLKLIAVDKRSGHARMLSATVTESRGGQLIRQGSAKDKARAVLNYLREHRLVDY